MRVHFGLAALVIIFGWLLLTQPSNERQWRADQAVLPYGDFTGESVRVHNVRNFTYASANDYTIRYYDKTYHLEDLKSVWFIVEPISDWEGSAHTFLSFDFDGEFIAVSVEARREEDEGYSPWKGLVRKYELMYVFADEQDIMLLRAKHRNHSVFLYPVNTTTEKMQLLFIDVVSRANKLREEPEFYNTLTNSCTTNIADHANAIVPGRVPFSTRVLASGYSDRYAHELGLIDTVFSLEELREKHNVTARAQAYNGGDFSAWIRQSHALE